MFLLKESNNIRNKYLVQDQKEEIENLKKEMEEVKKENSKLLISRNGAVSKHNTNKRNMETLANTILGLRSRRRHYGWGNFANFYYEVDIVKTMSQRYLDELKN
jgi:hypothetical protein